MQISPIETAGLVNSVYITNCANRRERAIYLLCVIKARALLILFAKCANFYANYRHLLYKFVYMSLES